MRAAWSLVGALVLGGCLLVTGSTSGYVEVVDAGAQAPTTSTCNADAGACLVVGCSSPADCPGVDGGPNGFCCLSATLSPPGAALACQAAGCAGGQSTVCATSLDCDQRTTCDAHACTLQQTSITFRTCGSFTCP